MLYKLALLKRNGAKPKWQTVREFYFPTKENCLFKMTKRTSMQNQMENLPDRGMHEYILVIQPHKELQTQIGGIKKEFADKYKTPQAFYTKPHLTLVNFVGHQSTQERVIGCIGRVAMSVTPFNVEIRNFGSFPLHTVYAAVTTNAAVQNLIRELKVVQSMLALHNNHKPHFIEQAHFSICRNLKPEQYEQAWLEYSQRNFTARFIANSLTLLQRPATEQGFRPVVQFEFQGLPSTKQGALFGSLPPHKKT